MISIADLRARDVHPSWQEGVAVLQELIQTISAATGSAEHLPDLEHIALIPNGDVVALPGSPVPDQPVRQAAVMLQLLTEQAATPPELDQFIERNLADPPQCGSVLEFSRNLAFFERPGRRADIERLVGRAMAADQLTRADEELQRLKERAAQAAPALESAPQGPMRLPGRGGGVVVVLAMILIAAAAAGVVWWWNARSGAASAASGEPPVALEAPGAEDGAATGETAGAGNETAAESSGQTGGIGSLLDRTTEAVRGAVSAAVGGGPATSRGTGDVDLDAGTPSRSAPQASDDEPALSEVPAMIPAPGVRRAGPSRPPVASAPSRSVAEARDKAAAAAAADAARIYTAADVSVQPPVLLRPVLPKEPPPNVPPEQVGTLRVLVDEHGDVEQVRLISPANRFHERMLVSAAKMWKFRPAYKDGEPVRYWTTVRLTI